MLSEKSNDFSRCFNKIVKNGITFIFIKENAKNLMKKPLPKKIKDFVTIYKIDV
jgi:hypothetical protein